MIEREIKDEFEVYRVENKELAFWVCPGLGNNLFRIKDKKSGKEILKTPPSLMDLLKQPVMWGMPHLYPPNRIRNGNFTWNGLRYSLPINTPEGNHIHGIVVNKQWEVENLDDKGDELSITSCLNLQDHRDLMKGYNNQRQFFRISYHLSGTTIETRFTVMNESNDLLPVGYGLHTWFSIDHEPERWSVQCGVDGIWELGSDTMPTGRLLPLGEFSGLEKGMNIKGKVFDTVFCNGGNEPIATLTRDDGYTIKYECSPEFKHWVFHTAGVADSVMCLEPYTWVTDAPNLKVDKDLSGVLEVPAKKELAFWTRVEISR